jgi:hypothetical protein
VQLSIEGSGSVWVKAVELMGMPSTLVDMATPTVPALAPEIIVVNAPAAPPTPALVNEAVSKNEIASLAHCAITITPECFDGNEQLAREALDPR